MKKPQIYEPKDQAEKERKGKSISFRVTEAIDKKINENAQLANMNKSDFIIRSCQEFELVIVPEGRAILQIIHQIHHVLRNHPTIADVEDIKKKLGQIVVGVSNINHSVQSRP